MDFSKFKAAAAKAAGSMKKTVEKTAANLPDSVTSAVSEVQKNVESGAQKMKASGFSEKFSAGMQSLAEKGQKTIDTMKQKSQGTDKAAKSVLSNSAETSKGVSPQGALKAIYYLIAADGRTDAQEMEKFSEIGMEMDASFPAHKDTILSECAALIEKYSGTADYEDVLHDAFRDALKSESGKNEAAIPAKLLLWDLLVTAFSDADYSGKEQHLVRYASRVLDISPTVLQEMEFSVHSVKALDQEAANLRSSSRPYNEVQPEVERIENRKSNIVRSIHEMITDPCV